MRHLAIRTGINVFEEVLSSLEKKVPDNYVKHITSANYSSFTDALRIRPLFVPYYLVYLTITGEEDSKLITFIKQSAGVSYIRLVIMTRSQEVFESLSTELKGFDFLFMDSYNVSDDFMCRYIRYKLHKLGLPYAALTENKIRLIRRRIRYKEYALDNSLELLARSKFTVNTIKELIQPYKGVTLSNIDRCFFDSDRSDQVAAIIFSHRFYVDSIYKSICRYLAKWFCMYDEYISGRLTHSTVMQWIEKYGSAKNFNVKYDYQAKRWLESFERHSYDMMMTIYIMLQEKQNVTSYRKAVLLLEILKGVIHET